MSSEESPDAFARLFRYIDSVPQRVGPWLRKLAKIQLVIGAIGFAFVAFALTAPADWIEYEEGAHPLTAKEAIELVMLCLGNVGIGIVLWIIALKWDASQSGEGCGGPCPR